jgi:hypothetical protein
MTTPLNAWVLDQLQKNRWTQSSLEKETGIPHATLSKDMESNRWLLERAIKVAGKFGKDYKSEEEFTSAGLSVVEWLKPHHRPKPPYPPKHEHALCLKDALEKAERVSPAERESMMCEALRTVRPARRAFLAVVATVVPSPFQNRVGQRALLEALYAAHDQGLMVLFIAPSEAKEKLWRDQCGFETQESAKHADGFTRYRAAYIEHLEELGIDQNIADLRMHFVQEDTLDVAGWQYIVSLIGETQEEDGRFNHPFMRVVERGPASEGRIFIVPHNDRLHVGLRKYVMNVLRRKYPDGEHPFAAEFLDRMGVG